jgi:uncharacterized membrane protein
VFSAPHQDIPRTFLLAYLLSMPIYCLVRLAGQPDWVGLSTALTAASLFAFSLTYAIAQHGLRRAVAMLMASFAIALTLEYLGSSYGILFGEYDYTDRLGPKLLGKVPAIIPIAWFMMLYPSWATAGYLLTRFRLTAVPMPAVRVGIAASAMTAWDLSLDPRMVADGNWVWRAAGPYFGIPLSNYLGWFVTAALIYFVWYAITRPEQTSHGADGPTAASSSLGFHYWPIWAYIFTWLGESVANAIFWGGPLVALAVFIGMGLFGGPALFNLWRSMQQTQPRLPERWSEA